MSQFLIDAAATGRVKTVAIVDDAYDPPGSNDISENAFNRFVQALEDDRAVASALAPFGVEDWEDYEQFTADLELIRRLWANHVAGTLPTTESSNATAMLFADVDLDRSGKRAQLKPLELLLATVIVPGHLLLLGSDADPEIVAQTDVVFLDLYLAEDIPFVADLASPLPKRMLTRARDRAMDFLRSVREVAERDPRAAAPAFVIISSLGTERIAEHVRGGTQQTLSRFRFVSKTAFEKSEPHELLAIADLFRTCEASKFLEPLQRAWQRVLADAQTWISDRIQKLTLADFGRLYHLSLRNEGQPVDDYLKELIGGALSERVSVGFGNLNLPRAHTSPFADNTNYYEPPSNAFAELYSANRITADRGYRGRSTVDPQSGDLYVDGEIVSRRHLTGRAVWAVMSPACDLMDRGKGPAAESVLLLDGTISATTSPRVDDPQLISWAGRYYDIKWRFNQPRTQSVAELRRDVKAHAVSWLGRLRGEHFLALQSQYFGALSRVGLMKSPRVFQPLAGEILATRNGEPYALDETFGAKNGFAFITMEKTASEVVFSARFVRHFWQLLNAVAADTAAPAFARKRAEAMTAAPEHIARLVESKTAPAHAVNNLLAVQLCAARTDSPNKVQNVILLRLWQP